MTIHDAIVVGGGPGGSTSAWELARAGARPLVLEALRFPRVKLCAGWVTRRVMERLELDPAAYPRTVEPFSTAALDLDGDVVETTWPRVVGYGIVRAEFDDFLLRRAERAGATVREGARVRSIERRAGRFVVESDAGSFATPVLVGAGGHGCPVARAFGRIPEHAAVVVTQESETRLGRERLGLLSLRAGVPELFPEPDGRGYGWVFAKGDFLNVGLGAVDDGRGLHARLRRFLARLRALGRLGDDGRLEPFRGHAYSLRALAPRTVAAPGVFLVGDAAALARPVSGEGIGPAVESGGLAAASALRLLDGENPAAAAGEYERSVGTEIGDAGVPWLARALEHVPKAWIARAGELVCRNAWLRRRLVFEGAFGMG